MYIVTDNIPTSSFGGKFILSFQDCPPGIQEKENDLKQELNPHGVSQVENEFHISVQNLPRKKLLPAITAVQTATLTLDRGVMMIWVFPNAVFITPQQENLTQTCKL